MVKPTFICIGVQKSGTTSLINYLNQNPDIYMHKNEIHFFDKPKSVELIEDDIKKYEELFDTNKLIVGEKTPSYNYLQFAMDRIYNYNPNIKLILILREPISRAYSQFNMENYDKISNMTDDEIIDLFEIEENIKLSDIEKNEKFYICRGFYDEIIQYILQKFNKKNIFIIPNDRIKRNKLRYYNQIFKFLGASELNNIENKDTNILNYKKKIPKKLEQKLYKIYKPHNEKLYKILGYRIQFWENYYNTIK